MPCGSARWRRRGPLWPDSSSSPASWVMRRTMSSRSSWRSLLTRGKSWASPVSVSLAACRTRWAIWAPDMRPVARSSMRGPCSPGLPARLSMPFAPRPLSQPLQVLDDHPRVAARALDGDWALGHLDPYGVVVGVGHVGGRLPARRPQVLEWVGGRLHVEDVGDPSPEEALVRLPLLVGGDGGGSRLVHGRVAAGQGGRHAANGRRAVLQAGGH